MLDRYIKELETKTLTFDCFTNKINELLAQGKYISCHELLCNRLVGEQLDDYFKYYLLKIIDLLFYNKKSAEHIINEIKNIIKDPLSWLKELKIKYNAVNAINDTFYDKCDKINAILDDRNRVSRLAGICRASIENILDKRSVHAELCALQSVYHFDDTIPEEVKKKTLNDIIGHGMKLLNIFFATKENTCGEK